MSAKFCQTSQKHKHLPILAVCLQQECSEHPYACEMCYKQKHLGHLILTFEYLRKLAGQVQSLPNYRQNPQLCVNEVDSMHKMINQTFKKLLGNLGNLINQEFKDKESFAKMISKNLNEVKLDKVMANIITRSQIPQETLNSYLSILRLYYFEGGYRSQKEENGAKLKVYIKQQFQRYQSAFQQLLKGFIDNVRNYKRLEDNQQEHKEEYQVAQQLWPYHLTAKSQIFSLNQAENKRKLLLMHNLYRNAKNQEERLQKVIIRQSKEAKIEDLIFQVDNAKIKQLTIINNATCCAINQKIAEQISKMVNLRVLRIFWAKGLSDKLAISMLKYMTNLQELCLSQFDGSSQFFIAALTMNNPKLTKVVFSIDPKHFVRYNQENFEVLNDRIQNFTPEQSWIDLSSSLQYLSNIELYFPQNVRYWIDFLKSNGQAVKEFALLACNQNEYNQSSYKPLAEEHTPIVQALSACTNLQCLRFQQVTFNEKSLERIIMRNKKLLSFIANECPSAKDKLYQTIGRYCPQLQELSISMDDVFSAASLHRITSLKTLVLSCCWGVNQDNFVSALPQLPHLKCLNIEQNQRWVTVNSIKALAALPHLKVLNISSNTLSASDIAPLSQMKTLKTLICANNFFSYTDIAKCYFAKTLKKLSIAKNLQHFSKANQHQKMQMSVLVQSFPALSHIKLIGFSNIKAEFFELMSSLFCVTVASIPLRDIAQIQSYCENAGIYFNHKK